MLFCRRPVGVGGFSWPRSSVEKKPVNSASGAEGPSAPTSICLDVTVKVVVRGAQWSPRPERDEPQDLPASAKHFWEGLLPRLPGPRYSFTAVWHFFYRRSICNYALELRVKESKHSEKQKKTHESWHPQESQFMFKHKKIPVFASQWQEVIIVAEIQHQGVAAEDLSVEAQLQKEPVVILANTIVYPGAVVIHLAYAVSTAAAVVGPLRPHQVTLAAQLPLISLWKWNFWAFWKFSWISSWSSQ